jgi:hypothetical protein
MHSETFRRTSLEAAPYRACASRHPGCAISVASLLFISAQPPLLFKEG